MIEWLKIDLGLLHLYLGKKKMIKLEKKFAQAFCWVPVVPSLGKSCDNKVVDESESNNNDGH